MSKEITVKCDNNVYLCFSELESIYEGYEDINKWLKRMRALLSASYPKEYIKNTKYDLYIYLSEETNAFSCKVEDEYIIAFSYGLFGNIERFINDAINNEEVRARFNLSNKEEEAYLMQALNDFVMWFISFHELGHILDGHNDYSKDTGLYLSEKDIMANILSRGDTLHQVLECDADIFAVKSMIINVVGQTQELLKRYKNDDEKTEIVYEGSINEFMIMFFAIYIVFLLLEESANENFSKYMQRKSEEGKHPFAGIRMTNVIGWGYYYLSSIYIAEYAMKSMNGALGVSIAFDRTSFSNNVFSNSLYATSYTKKGQEHLAILNNGWKDIYGKLAELSKIELRTPEEYTKTHVWVTDNGEMIVE